MSKFVKNTNNLLYFFYLHRNTIFNLYLSKKKTYVAKPKYSKYLRSFRFVRLVLEINYCNVVVGTNVTLNTDGQKNKNTEQTRENTTV